MTSENCPKCEKKLPAPFKSSGRQVCSGCGWTNKPTNSKQVNTSNVKLKLEKVFHTLDKKYLIIGGCSLAILIFGSWGLVSWADTRVSCKTKDGKPAYKTLKNIHTEWEDAVELAGSTSRMSLPPLVGKLQKVKRDLKTEEWKDCAKPAVKLLSDSMSSTIEGFITFLDSANSKWLYQSDFEKAGEKMSQYSLEYAKLMPNKERRIEEQKALAELEESQRLAREVMAKVSLGSAIRGEQTFHFENKEFTKSRSEVYLEDYKDEHYNIEIVKADKNEAILIANPKEKSNLKSFAEAIAYGGSSYKYERISCETNKPSTEINPPIFSSSKWSCGSGSHEIE